MNAHVAQHAFDRMIAQIAIAAVELQAAVDRLEAGVGREPFRHGGEPGRARLAVCDRERGTADHQSRGLELGRMIRDAELQRLEIREPLPELLALAHVFDGALEAELGAADRAGCDVEPPAIEPRHGDAEAVTLLADAVCDRNPAVLEEHHRSRLRFPAELLFLRAEREAARCFLNDEARNAVRAVLPGADPADVKVRDAAPGDECLRAIEHAMVAVAHGAGPQARGIGAPARLGQAIARKMLPGADRKSTRPS